MGTKTFLEEKVGVSNILCPKGDIHLLAEDIIIKMILDGMDTITNVPDSFDGTKTSYAVDACPSLKRI